MYKVGVLELYHKPTDPNANPKKLPGKKLKGKMALFVEEYLVDMSPVNAFNRAGYKSPSHKISYMRATEMMRHPAVKAAIDERMVERRARMELSVEYVVNKLVSIVEEADENPTAALRGLELLGRHLGMYRDKQEISGPDGSAIQVQEQKVAADVADFRSRIAGLASRGGAGTVVEFPKPGSSTGTED